MEKGIKDLIATYKIGENLEKSLLEILKRLEPAINKYARRVYYFEYEDMRQEIIIAVLEAVIRIEKYDNEGQCVKYLVNAIKIKYLELCRQENNWENTQMCTKDMSSNLEHWSGDQYKDIEFRIDMDRIKKADSKLKVNIANFILIGNMNDMEIAKRLHISRQYVNRCKKQIFKELADY